jgi:calcium-translocating P-type ATPase
MSPAAPTQSWTGLTKTEVEARRHRDGPNRLPVLRGRSPLALLAGQFVHFFAVMLWVAAGLAVVAGLPQLAIAIVLVILVNGLFAFVQEYRAEQAAEELRNLVPRRVMVIRDGTVLEIDASEIVVGDLVRLGPGDGISADLDVLESHGLQVDTSTLTGESVPSPVDAGETVYAGTFVIEGEATGTATATGPRTRLAGIARLAQAAPRPSPPLAIELRRVVRAISVIAISVGAAFFVTTLILGRPPVDGFILAVGVTVALVPEALLPTVTLSLAIGAQRMAQHHALVRRLESVETLGSTTFVCTDKTGTLTRNQMAVVEVWTPLGPARIQGVGYEPVGSIEAAEEVLDPLRQAAHVAVRCSTGRVVNRDGQWQPQGNPMEAALDAFARRSGLSPDADRAQVPDRRRLAFDNRRRRMSVVVGDQVLVMGAPDSVLPRCIEAPWIRDPDQLVEAMAARGLRMIAVAARPVEDGDDSLTADQLETHLRLLGVIGLEDPPREEAASALAACRRAGIKVAMVTGDHGATAAAIAREVGLLGPEALVLLGDDLPADDAALGELIDHDGIVLARVSPEQKVRIARALRGRGHVVAMTGDGVNDGPALHEADIGVAMGRSGTDVAREASDLVLLDDDFATIVAAIEHGRAIFANARRFLTYHLTDNVAELTPFIVWALSGGQFPLALGVLQILALDIGTDTLSATALGAEPPRPRTLEGRPAGGRLLNRLVAIRAFGILGPTEAVLGMTAFVVSLVAAGWGPGEPFPSGAALLAASGATFATVVIAQTANAFACRSTSVVPGALGWTSNRLLIVGASIELVIAAACLWIAPIASALGQQPPPLAGWLVALASAPAVLAVDAIHKALRRSGSASP